MSADVPLVEPEPPNAAFRLLSIKELAKAEQESSAKVCVVSLCGFVLLIQYIFLYMQFL